MQLFTGIFLTLCAAIFGVFYKAHRKPENDRKIMRRSHDGLYGMPEEERRTFNRIKE